MMELLIFNKFVMMKTPLPRLARVFFMSSFGSDNPFMLLAKVKEDKVADNLEIVD